MKARSLRPVLLATASTITIMAAGLQAATAQPAPAAGAPETVVVTGSLLNNSFTAPTPVTVLDSRTLQQFTPDSVMDAVSQLPALSGSQPSTNAGGVSAGGGSTGQATLALRNLGGNRTLVLLDGHRMGQTNPGGTSDVNLVPQALISHVDVITGGASATYGADAVAGAVNFVLNHNYIGFKASINGGETTYGDGRNGHASATYGSAVLGGHLRFEVSTDYFEEDGIGIGPIAADRRWFNVPDGAYPNLAATNPPTPTTTTNIVVHDVRFVNASYGGLITGVKGCASGAAGASCTALNGQQFLAGGVLAPFNKGITPGSTFTSGGDGPLATNGLSPAQHRIQAFGHVEYDLDDDTYVWAEAAFLSSHTYQYGAYPFENGTKFQFTIFPGNPYLPAPVATVLAANPNASFTLGRYSNDLIPIINNDLTRTLRFATGVNGKINSRWSYDASINYTRSAQYFDQTDTINRRLYAAADAVKNPATGAIVCRSTYFTTAGVFVPGGTGLDVGCIPIDPFGVGAIKAVTPDAIPYVERYDQGDSVYHQTNFDANLRGDLGDRWNLGAGVVSIALGVTYRRYDVNRVVDDLSNTVTSCTGLRGCPTALDGLVGGYQSYNPAPQHGTVSATEGFAEVGIPLLKDLPFVESLNLDIAGRMTDYSTTGVVYSDKVGLDWQVDDEVRFRATHSQDIRAPSLNDLFSSGTTATNTAVLPAATNLLPTGQVGVSVPNAGLSIGNPALRPESAQTVTLGTVYQPAWLEGFQGSVDYWSIGIGEALGNVGGQNAINGCYQGVAFDCTLITSGAGTTITDTRSLVVFSSTGVASLAPGVTGITVRSVSANINKQTANGLDVEAAYAMPFWEGRLTAHAIAGFNLGNTDSSRAIGSTVGIGTPNNPYWSGNLSLNYDTEMFSVNVQERLISGGKRNANWTEGQQINLNSVPLIGYTDLGLAYKFDSLMNSHDQLFFNVTNLFNQYPPSTVTGSSSFENPTNFGTYDVLGRRFTVGLRIAM